MRNNQNRLGAKTPAAPPAGTQPAASIHPSLPYAVPTEFVELPSRGKFYLDDHPLSGQETIEIKFMTAKEEDILASEALIRKGLVLDRLMENIVVDPEIDPKSLLIGDRNAIMIAARISAYGPEYEVNVYCTACDQVNEDYKLDLKKCKHKEGFLDRGLLNEHDIVFDEANKNFTIRLPKSGLSVGLRLITGSESLELDDIDENSAVTDLLTKLVKSVEGQTDLSTVKSFVRYMPAQDSRFLRKIYLQLMPDVDLTQDFTCNHCGRQEDKEVPLDAGFFWPR